ncbi:hypothetical protein Moror_14952 [Moniliophthora roreri MCA 2997]|uniref:MYND-type domain-containing protein n=2 Tax=Moniliophthora roreri TaxID=221103 RepID=V2WDF3_MONRO|nr:hypothetical protein Moror_14952 [Moniliophthora roreri MCA 2997]
MTRLLAFFYLILTFYLNFGFLTLSPISAIDSRVMDTPDAVEKRLEELEELFLTLNTKEEKRAAFHAFEQREAEFQGCGCVEWVTGFPNNFVPPDYKKNKDKNDTAVAAFMEKHDLTDEESKAYLFKDMKDPPSLSRLPCAYHDVGAGIFCSGLGMFTCSECRLVRYCSKKCQKQHWKRHRINCQDRMRAKTWKPRREIERGTPSFLEQKPAGRTVMLWGSTPAIDILKVSDDPITSQSIKTRNLSLAFIASGDLRNVIKTVNALPSDYTGNLSILLNDNNSFVVARNFLMLTWLGIMDNVDEAAEFAVHYWYSVMLQSQHCIHASLTLTRNKIFKEGFVGQNFPLTQTSTISTNFDKDDASHTVSLIRADMLFTTVDIRSANNAWAAVMNGPDRVDYREQLYGSMKPSHRVAMQRWRRFGIVQPLGAPDANFSLTNSSLLIPYSDMGDLFIDDTASPLQGWDLSEVVKAGKEHGTTEEDIMGCLFFYVKDQLLEFSKRLRRFHIAITMYDQDAATLPASLPPHLRRFDRIEVSNVMDEKYLGIDKVLQSWGPLLDRSRDDSALIGSFASWSVDCRRGSASDDSELSSECARKLSEMKPNLFSPLDFVGGPQNATTRHLASLSAVDLAYDNSVAFKKYLKNVGAETAARRAGLRMRVENKVVPPRPGVKIGSKWSALPEILADEDWDTKFSFTRFAPRGYDPIHSERFVEWVVDHGR